MYWKVIYKIESALKSTIDVVVMLNTVSALAQV
jgi:hypothetical protein